MLPVCITWNFRDPTASSDCTCRSSRQPSHHDEFDYHDFLLSCITASVSGTLPQFLRCWESRWHSLHLSARPASFFLPHPFLPTVEGCSHCSPAHCRGVWPRQLLCPWLALPQAVWLAKGSLICGSHHCHHKRNHWLFLFSVLLAYISYRRDQFHYDIPVHVCDTFCYIDPSYHLLSPFPPWFLFSS